MIDIKDSITFTMHDTLDQLEQDCTIVKMSPNPLKCEVMYICPPKRPIVFPQLTLNDCDLPIVHNFKLLGVHINSDLNWDDHVKYIASKTNKLIFILYRARQFSFNQNVMFTLYSWFIRTSLEYAGPVWHPGLTQAHHDQLERIQKRCFRIILGGAYQNYDNALRQLNAKSLYNRREDLTIGFGKSLLKSSQHRHFLPQTMHEVHGRNNRTSKQLLQPFKCRTARYENSSIPYIITKLNALSKH